jgi:hypothetical protein
LHRERVIGPIARRLTRQRVEAAHGHDRAGEHREGKRHFGHDEETAQPVAAPALRRASAAVIQRLLWIGATGDECRHGADDDGGGERHDRGEREDRATHVDACPSGIEAHQLGGQHRAHGGDAPHGE